MRTYVKKCRHGELVLIHGDMISEYVNLYGEWCEGEVELFSRFVPGDGTVIEVGSNIGMHAVPLARMCARGKMICFEPQRVIFQVLCANLAINSLTHVHAVHAAVTGKECGERDGAWVEIPSSEYEAAWNYGSFSIDKGFNTEGTFGAPVQMEKVALVSIDAYAGRHGLSRVDFLKIDAEGYEAKVLEGAARTIKACRPVLFVENNNEEGSAALIENVRSIGYRPFWVLSARYRPGNFNGISWQVKGVDINMLCIPTERASPSDLVEAVDFAQVRSGQVKAI